MKINLIPYGGLGNRMRVIASVYKYSLENNHELVVYWNRQKDFNQSFKKCFAPTINLKVIDHLIGFNYNNPYKLNLFIPRLLDKIIKRKSFYFVKENELEKIIREAVKNKIEEITVSTCFQHGEMYPLSEIFCPNRDILRKIDDIYKSFSEYTVGIHIRRTDNVLSKNISKPEIFKEKVRLLFKEKTNAKVFLCTDDAVIKEQFKCEFGENIITYESRLDRYTPKGITDAIVELFLLAKTNIIWGSFNSSYTDIASQIYGIERVIVK